MGEGRGWWEKVEEGGRGWRRVEEGGGWERVEEDGRRWRRMGDQWRRVGEGGEGWKRVREGGRGGHKKGGGGRGTKEVMRERGRERSHKGRFPIISEAATKTIWTEFCSYRIAIYRRLRNYSSSLEINIFRRHEWNGPILR